MNNLGVLKRQSVWILVSLSLQYVLGMVINMFGVAPDDPKFATESPLVKISFLTHGINGLVLPFFALSILFFTYKSGNEMLRKIALYGFISVLVAAIGGISTLLLKDPNNEFASLTMAIAFLFAFFFYIKYFLFLRK